MYLLAPTSHKEIFNTSQWFKHPTCRKLNQKKNVVFGFELKGELETIVSVPELFWGCHLPTNLAEELFYHPEKKKEMFGELSRIAKLKPAYVNVHGPKLWWQPPKENYIKRYEVRSTPEEIFKLLDYTVSFVKELKEIFSGLTLENTTLVDYYRADEKYLPYTSLQTSLASINDIFYVQAKTSVELLVDIEHIIIGSNFLNRKKNYAELKKEKFNPTQDEKRLEEIFGYKIRQGIIPYAEPELNVREFIKKAKARRFHVTGSSQDVIMGVKDLSHGPIKLNDQTFRENLRMVLSQNPESILLETANSRDNDCFSDLRPNETELSFYNLCEILLEEL